MNHRHGKRFDSELRVTLSVVDRGELTGCLVNVSMTGAAILLDQAQLLELYTPCEMFVELEDQLQPQRLLIQGFVVRTEYDRVCVMFMNEMVHLVYRLRFGEAVDELSVS